MRADFRVVLDACVLANYGVANLLLSLAEKPRLYLPVWSEEILEETRKTQSGPLGWDAELVEGFHRALREAFPESMVAGFGHLIGHCENDEGDRHVLACAIHCKAEVILTFNLRHFPESATRPWGVSALHPESYLVTLFSMEPLHVMRVLSAIAEKRKLPMEDHLIDLGRFVPQFSARLLDQLNS